MKFTDASFLSCVQQLKTCVHVRTECMVGKTLHNWWPYTQLGNAKIERKATVNRISRNNMKPKAQI